LEKELVSIELKALFTLIWIEFE